MRTEEARAICQMVLSLALPAGSVCLNLGSSTQTLREKKQPHIQNELLGPMSEAGLLVIHCDAKADEGVDLVGDVLDTAYQRILQGQGARLLLCSNMLEHLADPRSFALACSSLVPRGGYAIVSVPLSYPYHPDPIDTMLRPTPETIATYFPGWSLVRGHIVTSTSFLQDSLAKENGYLRLAEYMGKLLLPFYKARSWKRRAHRAMWLFRPYLISIAMLRKDS